MKTPSLLVLVLGALVLFFATPSSCLGALAQQAYVKASNTGVLDQFGTAVAISGDTLIVGAPQESSSAQGVNGAETNDAAFFSGAAYIYVRNGTNWTKQAYLKASDSQNYFYFGSAVAIDGDTVVVGAPSANPGGSAYVFVRNGTNWTEQRLLKASNAGGDFGGAVSLSGDTVVIGAKSESSAATGVNGVETTYGSTLSGAAYVFVRSGTNWAKQAYLKASNANPQDQFGGAVALAGDTMVIGASQERSAASGVNGDQNDNSTVAGAAYVFTRTGTNWSQPSYLKASNPGGGANAIQPGDNFGYAAGIAGGTIVLGALGEDSGATGVNGNQNDNSQQNSGAAYVFVPAAVPTLLYTSVPAPGASVDFGLQSGMIFRSLVIGNRGPGTLRILSITTDPPLSPFTLEVRNCSGVEDTNCVASLPFAIPGDDSGVPLRLLLIWNAGIGDDHLDTTLRVVSDDPLSPTVTYRLTGIDQETLESTLEGVIILAFNRFNGGGLAQPRKSGGAGLASLPTTATFIMEPSAPHSLTTEIPAYLGGGSVTLSNFTGSFTVSVLPIPNDTNHAFLRVESGAFTAPSFTLPSGLESGLNVLTFGPPAQSSGLLNLTNGQYEVTATATITNQLIPQGVTVRGNYTGVYDFQNETANLVSDSADLFTPSGMMALTRSTNGLWLTWVNTNAVEHAVSVTGPWQVLTNAVSPHLVHPTNAQQFFRLATP